MKKERKRKFIWRGKYQIESYEELLRAQAKEGWHIQKISSFFTTFVRGEPKEVCYRIAKFKEKGMAQEIHHFKEEGWEFAFNYGDYYVFFKAGKEDILVKDPKKQWKMYYKDKYQGEQTLILGYLLLSVFLYFMIIRSAWWENFGRIIIENNMITLFNLLLCSFLIIISGVDLLQLYKIKKILLSGSFLPKQKARNRRGKLLKIFAWVMILCIVIQSGIDFKVRGYDTLPIEETNVPTLRITELNPTVDKSKIKTEENVYTKGISILAPVQLEMDEYIKGTDLEHYKAYLHSEYYELIHTKIANQVYDAFRQRKLEIIGSDEVDIPNISSPDFQRANYLEYSEEQYLFLLKDKKVLSIMYKGTEDLQKYLPLLSERLDNFHVKSFRESFR